MKYIFWKNYLRSLEVQKAAFIWRFPRWLKDFFRYRRLHAAAGCQPPVQLLDTWPCLFDSTAKIGYDRHYLFHTAWAARKLAACPPEKHIDVSSRLWFVGILSAFIPVEYYEYRPADFHFSDLELKQADILHLPFPDQSVASLSCMHVVEHVGLGRYGDPLDPLGDRQAIHELQRVLKPGGKLLFVVPVAARSKVLFNAHRVYQPADIQVLFDRCQLEEFALIPDQAADGDLIVSPSQELLNRQEYGCGCFAFQRNA